MIKPFTRQQILDTGSTAKHSFHNSDIGIGSIVEVSEEGIEPDVVAHHKESGSFYGYIGIVMTNGFYDPNLVAVLWEKGCGNTLHWDLESLKLHKPS